MKFFIFISVFIFLFLGCKTKRIPIIEHQNDSIMIEKVITVISPEDSANIRALLECDENGKVVLKWFDEEVSKNAQLRFKLDSLGNLSANFKSGGDSIKTVFVNKTIKRIETIYKTVPSEISKWNRRMINLGYCFLGIVIIFIGWGFFKIRKLFI